MWQRLSTTLLVAVGLQQHVLRRHLHLGIKRGGSTF